MRALVEAGCVILIVLIGVLSAKCAAAAEWDFEQRARPRTLRDCPAARITINLSVGEAAPWRTFCYEGGTYGNEDNSGKLGPWAEGGRHHFAAHQRQKAVVEEADRLAAAPRAAKALRAVHYKKH